MKKITLFLLTIVAFNTYAQKLPNVQQTSLRAPANVKIDGKAAEWGNFAAYNYATSLHYTMANDDKNLYLAIHATDPNVLAKITQRGIVLVIDPSGKKDDKNAVTVQYPVFEVQYKNKPNLKFSNAGGLMAVQREAIRSNPDSMLAVANNRLKLNDKYIRTAGMVDVDTLLSVYNDKDIVARQGFEKWESYNYEMSIPLKYLKLPSSAKQAFSYHIVLNGIDLLKDSGMTMTMIDGRMTMKVDGNSALYKKDDFPALTTTTDFWGEYTLAK
ncbi:hypothetical protein ACFQZS_01460 [Mucilaginibacter calamicampi]|uniref:Uncharacterized protein n=1 Tax=Mucilaginibacter calamicampi TaxID=1302352 RepID=A0ABW2YRF2_9SPHI